MSARIECPPGFFSSCVGLFLPLPVVGCYFTRDPRSTSLSAKAHGRVGIAIKALELMLSVTYALNHTFSLSVRLVSADEQGADQHEWVCCFTVYAPRVVLYAYHFSTPHLGLSCVVFR